MPINLTSDEIIIKAEMEKRKVSIHTGFSSYYGENLWQKRRKSRKLEENLEIYGRTIQAKSFIVNRENV
jgi:hypothetical protein